MSDIALNVLGFAAGVLTTVAFVPQVIKLRRTRSARDISLGMYTVFTSGVALWLVYGIALGSMPIVVANVFTLALALAVLAMKVRYG
ncbi:MAG TPA: SemiSWEET transporter [Burkholderiales bacterium]